MGYLQELNIMEMKWNAEMDWLYLDSCENLGWLFKEIIFLKAGQVN